jgi:hypothetical protein
MHGTRNSGCGIWLLGLALVFVSYFGPWIPHKTVALIVTGFELAEFAKFFPQVQGGVVPIHRVLFYSPFVAALFLLALLASRSAIRPVRLIVPLFAAAALLVALLPYSVVDGLRQALTSRSPFAPDPEYTEQLAVLFVGVVLVLLTPLAGRLSRRARSILVALLALVGAVPALWQFVLLHPLVVALYDTRLGPGWGLIGCMVGFALLLVSAVFTAASPRRSSPVEGQSLP